MLKKMKGFTLIECLVALAILGVASLTMAQIYARVAYRNRMNNLVNTSLVNQMEYVEKATGTKSVNIEFNGGTKDTAPAKPPHAVTHAFNDNYLNIGRIETDSSGKLKYDTVTGQPIIDDESRYSYPVNVYVLQSLNKDGDPLNKTKDDVRDEDYGNTSGYGEDNNNLRYKYLLGAQ